MDNTVEEPDVPGTSALVTAIKTELKLARKTNAQLTDEIGVAESSVKRMLSRGELTLARIDDICRALRIDFADLSQHVVEKRPQKHELTLAQERAVMTDRRLLLMAICCLSQWTFEQIVETYR